MKVLLRVAKEAKRYSFFLILTGISTIILTVINLIAPRLMANMTRLVSNGLDEAGLQTIVYIALLLLGLYLAKILFRFLSNYLAHKAAWNLVEILRMKVYSTLQEHSMDFYRQNRTGDLISRTVNDTATFELLYAHLMPESITNIITFVGVTVILLTINVKLALLTCLPIPLILVAGWVFAKKVRPRFRTTQKFMGEMSAQLQDNYAGAQEIQIFGQQEPAREKLAEHLKIFTKNMLLGLKVSAVFHPSIEFLTGLGTVIVVGFGGLYAYRGQLAIEDIIAFLLYLTLFYAPITGLANLLEQMQQALAGAERVIEILDYPSSIKDEAGAKPIENAKGHVSFENVSFHYNPDAPVLKNVSFDVQPGKMVALVGATGVGKTTLTQLVARFYDPIDGEIKLDGINLREIELASLRRSIAMVPQDTFLFNGTIAENIAFARPSATIEEVYEAAKTAKVYDDIMEMPDGFETLVGERGARLSGGQKQRIAIARAVIYKAPVLILDEATASVDVQTESDIQQAIAGLAGTRTIIVIAHRLSTVQNADQILVFQDGEIIQRGTHTELSNAPGLYRDMCEVQAKGARM